MTLVQNFENLIVCLITYKFVLTVKALRDTILLVLNIVFTISDFITKVKGETYDRTRKY